MGRIRWIVIVFFCAINGQLLAQSDALLSVPVQLDLGRVTLQEGLTALEKASGVTIAYSNNLLPNKKIKATWKTAVPLQLVLDEWLRNEKITYKELDGNIVLFKKETSRRGKLINVSGFLEDAVTGEKLLYAVVEEVGKRQGVLSNNYGYYSLKIPSGKFLLRISYVGYQPLITEVEAKSNLTLDFKLQPSLLLREVIVESSNNEGVDSWLNLVSGGNMIPKTTLKLLPSPGGEPDPIRLLYNTTGVQTGADGFGGLSVRGGNVDQNLFLLDGVPVYNATHAVGLFSVYNADAVRSMKHYKGVTPAHLGGRASSVFEVHTKEGNLKSWESVGNLGLTSVKASLEGPLVKEKVAIFVSARRALFDVYRNLYSNYASKDENNTSSTAYFFFDINAKIHAKINDKNKIFLSFYTGSDILQEEKFLETAATRDTIVQALKDQNIKWGNQIAALRWNHLLNDHIFINTTLTYSRFFFLSNNQYDTRRFIRLQPDILAYDNIRYESNNEDIGFMSDADFFPNNQHHIKFGTSFRQLRFRPGVSLEKTAISNSDRLPSPAILAYEWVNYIEDAWLLHPLHNINIGLRMPVFFSGSRTYFQPEPRIFHIWKLNNRFSMRTGVGRHTQNLHQLSSTGVGLPRDIWVPSTDQVQPIDSWQGHYAWLFTSDDKKWNSQLEGFYKSFSHILSLEEGFSFQINANNWVNKVIKGTGRSYGIEYNLERKWKKGGMHLGYTLSYSTRQFTEEINNGDRFSDRMDRRHNFILGGDWKIKDHLTFSANWVFRTGTAFSSPESVFSFNQNGLGVNEWVPFPFVQDVINYGTKNDDRLANVHHLDMNLDWQLQNKTYPQSIQISIYNLYSRINPIYNTLRREPDAQGQLQWQAYKISLFPIFPSIRYARSFTKEKNG